MEDQNVDTPQVETQDRRAILEQSLEAADHGEPVEAKTRDDSERFTKTERQPEQEAEQEDELDASDADTSGPVRKIRRFFGMG